MKKESVRWGAMQGREVWWGKSGLVGRGAQVRGQFAFIWVNSVCQVLHTTCNVWSLP